MISTIATLIQDDVHIHRVDHRAGSIYLEHGGRDWVIVAADVTDTIDEAETALAMARAAMGRGGVEA